MWAPTFRGNAAVPWLVRNRNTESHERNLGTGITRGSSCIPHLKKGNGNRTAIIPCEKIFAVADPLIGLFQFSYLTIWCYRSRYSLHRICTPFDHARGFYVPYDSFPMPV